MPPQSSSSWQNISVFVSSTFNDMHAERDYLVKRVFPELREWCEQRKLRLVDVDLRWGITEADATSKNVVNVCLNRIDECRPFFLCFLGQRRGWVPGSDEIARETYTFFPDIQHFIGSASVTEMEILHAVVDPLNKREAADRAFFYLRDPSFLEELPNEPDIIRKIYTNDSISDPATRRVADDELRVWREEKILNTGRPIHCYTAVWDPEESTPELSIPLQCPSRDPQNQERWKNQWRKVGLDPPDFDLTDEESLAQEARTKNAEITKGRLCSFYCGDEDLATVVLRDLTTAIAEKFPHLDITVETPLQRELDQQEQFLALNCDGFIERVGDFDALNAYVNDDSRNVHVLTGVGGMGKTMLLANWIDRYRNKFGEDDSAIYYRFIGASDYSTEVEFLLQYLLLEMKENAQLLDVEIPTDPEKMRKLLPGILEEIGKRKKTIIVIDAINQLKTGLSDVAWFPWELPANIKFIISFKCEGELAEEFYRKIKKYYNAEISSVKPFQNANERELLVNAYLNRYLKSLDKNLIDEIINVPGATNPLFLKVVLSELRVYGAFGSLSDKIKHDFGTTPVSAFHSVLQRLENDPTHSPIKPQIAIPLIFGLLSHARRGLSEEELAGIVLQELKVEDLRERLDTIRVSLRQIKPFLAHRGGRQDFFYDSFRIAAIERYEGGSGERYQRPPTEWNKILADYFEQMPFWISPQEKMPTLRRIEELPYHLQSAEEWQRLTTLLSNLDYFAYAWDHDLDRDVVGYWQSLRGRSDPADHYHKAIAKLEESIASPLDLVPNLRSIGYLLDRMGNFKESREFFARSGAINQKGKGESDPDTLKDWRWLGLIYYMGGDFENALVYLTNVLSIQERDHDYKSRFTADLLSDIGLVHWQCGNYDEAKDFTERCLRLREDLFGKKHRDVALSLNNLAAIYHDNWQYQKALEHFLRAMEIREQVLSPNDTDIAQTASNIGSTYTSIGKYQEASEYLTRALRIFIHAHGEFHPYIAQVYNNLSCNYQLSGDLDEAERMMLHALRIDKVTVDANHPNLINHLLNLGVVYAKKGRFEYALKYKKMALEKAEIAYKPDNIFIVHCLTELATTYLKIGDFDSAEPLLLRAKDIGDRTLNQPHHLLSQITHCLELLSIGKRKDRISKISHDLGSMPGRLLKTGDDVDTTNAQSQKPLDTSQNEVEGCAEHLSGQIVLLQMGKIPQVVMEEVANRITDIIHHDLGFDPASLPLHIEVIQEPTVIDEHSFDWRAAFSKVLPKFSAETITLILTSLGLWENDSNPRFIFGSPIIFGAAVLSTRRFSPLSSVLNVDRFGKAGIKSIGMALSLPHCDNLECIMAHHKWPEDFDLNIEVCETCRGKLKQSLENSGAQ